MFGACCLKHLFHSRQQVGQRVPALSGEKHEVVALNKLRHSAFAPIFPSVILLEELRGSARLKPVKEPRVSGTRVVTKIDILLHDLMHIIR